MGKLRWVRAALSMIGKAPQPQSHAAVSSGLCGAAPLWLGCALRYGGVALLNQAGRFPGDHISQDLGNLSDESLDHQEEAIVCDSTRHAGVSWLQDGR